MKKVLYLTTLLGLVLTSSVWAADISGTWALTMEAPQGGDESFDLAIKSNGANLTITCSNHPVLQTLEGTGTLKGDEIKMDLTSSGEQFAGVKISFTGKVTGNKMAGTREIDSSAVSSEGGGGGAPGGAGGGAPGGEGGGAPGGGQAAGGQGGQAPGGAPSGGGQAPSGGQGGQGGAPSGAGGAPGGGQAAGGGAPGGSSGDISDAWTAVKK